jgi:hypothetical protein
MLGIEELKLFKDSQILELITIILNYSYKEKIKSNKNNTIKTLKPMTSSPILTKLTKYTEKKMIEIN